MGALFALTACSDKHTKLDIDGTVTASKANISTMAITTQSANPYVYLTSNLDSNVIKIETTPYDYEEWSVPVSEIKDKARPAEYFLVRTENLNHLGTPYNDNYVGIVTNITIKYIYARNLPATPTKEGYTFNGWYTDSACTNKFVGAVVEGNITLYAGWTINTYTITYVKNNGESNTTKSVTYKGKAENLAAPTIKEGYTFNGWYTDSACTKPYDFNSEIKGNITLYAGWELKTYTVTFIVDGEVYDTIEVVHGMQLGDTAQTALLAKYFTISTDREGNALFNSAITEDMTLHGTLNADGVKALTAGDWLYKNMWWLITIGAVLVALIIALGIKVIKG